MGQETNQTGTKLFLKKWLLPIIVCIVAAGVGLGIAISRGSGAGIGDGQAEVPDFDGKLETPVGTLLFPEELAKDVFAKDVSRDGRYAVSLYGIVGKEEVLLFTLSVGEGGEGYEIGSAPGTGGTQQAVFLDISSIEAKNGWTQAEAERVTMLQSCVNELIAQINQLDGFQGPA